MSISTLEVVADILAALLPQDTCDPTCLSVQEGEGVCAGG